jgi:hypothetical protein
MDYCSCRIMTWQCLKEENFFFVFSFWFLNFKIFYFGFLILFNYQIILVVYLC